MPGQQAADAAHVVVAVAADLVADAVQDQRPVLERLERLEALLERERLALPRRARRSWASTPLGLNMTTSRCLRRCLVGEAQAGQVQDERQGRRADPQVADELASVAISGPRHVLRMSVGERRSAFNDWYGRDGGVGITVSVRSTGASGPTSATISTISLRMLKSFSANDRRRSGELVGPKARIGCLTR